MADARGIIEDWLSRPAVGSIMVNQFQGGVTSISLVASVLTRNAVDLLGHISRQLEGEFDEISIKRAKVGYSVQTKRTVRPK